MQVKDSELVHQFKGESPIRTLRYLLKDQRKNVALAVFFFSIKHSPAWLIPVITANMIDIVVEKKSTVDLAINSAALIFVVAQNFPTNLLYVRFLATAIRETENRLRSALVVRMQQLSIGYYQKTNAGALQTKVVRDVENIEQMLRHMSDGGLAALNGLIGAIVVTSIRVPNFLIFFIVVAPIASITIIRLRKSLNEYNEDFRSQIEKMSSRVNEMTTLLTVTRAHGLERRAVGRMKDSFATVQEAGLRLDRINGRFNAAAWVTFQMANVLCLILSAYFALNGMFGISAGDVVLLTSNFGMLIGSIILLASLAPAISKGFASITSLGEVLESPDLEINQGKKVVEKVDGVIEFSDVAFTYPTNHKPSLRNITFSAKPGQMIALVGPSGSGKSTLINLVIGFLRPSSGSIRVDTLDYKDLDLRTVRKFLSVVPQESVLFDGTIAENISYGLSDVSESDIRTALKDANALEFVEAFDDGIETIVGERGARLSGGQRQRLAIARALIRNPRILILDEATSALDSESERLIQDALSRLMLNRTTLVVAHRLSTIKEADLILVLEDGAIVQTGTHAQLVLESGVYKRLYDAQSFIPEE
ncbi:MAG: ABC transporter ATP-binding protein/permease [Candidatus Planktophila sp.]|nr:ABC transporter ATP-binding protein/permease [Candidatus Planktophila sp.]